MLPPVAKITDAFTPRLVAAGFKVRTHNGLHLVGRYPVLQGNLLKARMVRQRHFDYLANLGGGHRRRHIVIEAIYQYLGQGADDCSIG